MSIRHLALALTLLGAGSAPRAVVAGPETPRYHTAELKWSEYRDRYESRYPAVELEAEIKAKLNVSSTYKLEMDVVETYLDIVFDPERAEAALSRTFYYPNWVDVKKVYAWSHVIGEKGVTWAEPQDINQKVGADGVRKVAVAVPGVSGPGVCGIEIRYEFNGLGLLKSDFESGMPLVHGSVQLLVRSPSHIRWFQRMYSPDVEAKEVQKVRDGFLYEWLIRDQPPRCSSRFASKQDSDRATVILVPRQASWKGWARAFTKFAARQEIPDKELKAARDTLAGADAPEIVRAVARRIDGRGGFRILGDPRTRRLGTTSIEKMLASGEGTAFGKAILANTYLNALGVSSHLVLAASRYDTKLDFRLRDPYSLGATVLWIPDIHPKFIWDVADRWTPIGEGGADLFNDMLVCHPELEDPLVRAFPIDKGIRSETRVSEWTLDPEGALTIRGRNRIVGEPVFEEVDPWGPESSLQEPLGRMLPDFLDLEEAAWMSLGSTDGRLTDQSPGEYEYTALGEAVPAGSDAWRFAPFSPVVPDYLHDLAEEEPGCPLALFDRISLEDSIRVELGTFRVSDGPPKRTEIRNDAGYFGLSWSIQEESVWLVRTLSIRPRRFAPEEALEVADLIQGWTAAAGASWQFNPR